MSYWTLYLLRPFRSLSTSSEMRSALDRHEVKLVKQCRPAGARDTRPLVSYRDRDPMELLSRISRCGDSMGLPQRWIAGLFCCRESVAVATQWVSAALNRRPFCCRESVAALLLVVAISRREDWAVALLADIRYIACQGTGPRQAPLFCGRPSFKTGRMPPIL